ncbi:hydroxyacid dehydrogenase [Sphingopyxis sp. H038]|uniref:NAD(P)-dependent oxidoreductase n=1 Tax=unclassified Sphingopyxis TaxID=2614943 RepID=UPI000731DB1D|nr:MULTISPECIES: NAD(P)-dependent oxidoreductase [unclassified Sphingopyxis]KTD99932.1 hydroxyacid dehydrogenase [Sphingopyxis sp. H012]KTE07117.1 hydroxyacid dehydrogenase [Sphingopyxis sp. H053]KTE09057.1 hydroxyacid dehydrogenase [Sphingopyxis sp. H093]KTE18460.1 hydroxyacid dehydrogenase [Sphingopyxis sp. H080]KTE36357.1 hydroxyacid dehydrogenase [Sphingopyxis sp. H038]
MIVLHARPSPGFREAVDAIFGPGVVVHVDEAAPLDEVAPEITALLHVLTPVTPEFIASAPNLKLIQKLGVGVNTIALDAARSHGVAVCNMPGTNSQAVAEMALSLMMAVLRRTCFFDARTRAGEGWTADPSELDSVGEVAGRTVGLVGFGHSAQLLAPVLAALGAKVVYTARNRRDCPYEYRSFNDLIAEADIVSLHMPLTDETRASVDPFAMKKGAVLVNTARGELVDQARLVEALTSGHLRGAGLDVFAEEPLPRGNPLLGLPGVVLAPHIAWLTPETLVRSLTVAHENCRRLAAGETLLHQVV